MTLHNRQLPGHRLVARQKGGSLLDPNGNGNGVGDGNGSGNGSASSTDAGPTTQPSPSTTPTQTSTKSTPTPTQPTTSKTHQQPTQSSTNEPEQPTTTPTTTPTTSSTTSSSTSTSSSDTSSSTSSTSSITSTSKTSIAPVIVTGTPVILTSITSGLQLPSGTSSAAPSATTSAAPSSGTGAGTIIGGVVGGLVAIAAIGIIASFILRRLRKRREEDEFNSDDFVRPPNLSEPDFQRSSTFDPVPPNMAQLNRGEVMSTYSNPGMAGHGAYAYGDQYGQSQAPVGAGMGHGGMQERANYVYGQGYEGDDNVSDHAHGAYSSQPMAQAAYNPEAYGSYAYSTEGNTAAPGGYVNYQPEPQHPQHPQPGFAHGGDDDFAPLSSPYDSTPSAGSAASHPPALLVAGAPAVAAGRSTNTRSVYEEEDAYGGI